MAHWRQFIDFDLEFLTEVLRLIDSKLSELSEAIDEIEDPDMTGHYDRVEYATGLGFAACQQYINAVMGGVDKKERTRRLSLGPAHRLGDPIVAVVNAAANYWKHSSEWGTPAERRIEEEREKTRKRLLNLGVDLKGSYPLSCVLAELSAPGLYRFEDLLPFLIAWRDVWLSEKDRHELDGEEVRNERKDG